VAGHVMVISWLSGGGGGFPHWAKTV
jgi:hypothetical protein